MSLPAALPHRLDIQGLRAIAVTIVVIAHAGATWLPGGFVGVDLFFVLSGYLITGLLAREFETSGRIRLAQFFARRFRRLLPALLTMLVLVALLAALLLSGHEVRTQSASLGFAATWTSNLFFAFSALDYFNELQARDFFLHTWSLGVEEQFYLFWPFVVMAGLTLANRSGDAAKRRATVFAVLAALALLSLLLCLYWSRVQPPWSFYLMPSRIWQFALGAAVFFAFGGTLTRSIAGDALGVTGLLLIVLSAVLLHPGLIYPGFWALLPSLGAALVIAAGTAGAASRVGRWLSHPWLVWLGDRSYSWYLWHWPLLKIGEALGMDERPAGIVAVVLSSLLLADLSYRFVEHPFWRGRWCHASARRTLLLSILAMMAAIAATTRYLEWRHPAVGTPGAPSITAAARSDMPAIYAMGCDRWYHDAEVRPCLLGDAAAPKTVLLIGDSIGAQWFSLLPGVFAAPQWRWVALTKSACPMVDEDWFYPRIGKTYTVCSEWRDAALHYVETLRPDVVLVGSSAGYDFSDAQWREGSGRVLARLSAAARQVVILAPTPAPAFDGLHCLERLRHEAATSAAADAVRCSSAPADRRFEAVAGHLGAAARQFANVHLLDLNDKVCPDDRCAAQRDDGVFVFRDALHVTDTFVRRQIPVAAARLEALGIVPPTPLPATQHP